MGLLHDGKLNKEESGYLGHFSKGLQTLVTLHRIPTLPVTLPITTPFPQASSFMFS